MADQQKGLGERVGNEAHDAPDTGNPLKVGGHATAGLRSAVGADDRADLSCDLAGQLRITAEPTDPVPFALTEDTTDTIVAVADDANKAIRVNIVAGGGAGGTSETDNSAFIGGSTGVTPMGAIFDATPPTITDGSVGAPRMDSDRILMVNLAAQSVPGGIFVEGTVPHDAPDSGDPVLVGAHANAALPTAVAENDRVRASYDLQGQARITAEPADPVPFALTEDTTNTVVAVADDANKAVRVNLVAGGGSGGTNQTDNAIFTGGSTAVTPMGAIFDATPPTITDGSVGAPRMSSARILLSEVSGDIAHNSIDSGNPVKVGGRARSILSAATAEDDRVDAIFTTTGGALSAGVDGTNVLNIAVNASGQLEVDIAAQQGGDVNVAQATAADLNATVVQATASNLNAQVSGDIAHDAPDSGNPIKVGGVANASLPTGVGSADRVNATFSTTGGSLISGTDGVNIINVEVNASGQLEVDIAAQQGSALTTQGDVAHDDPDTGNTVKIGGRAGSVTQTAVGVGDRVEAAFSLVGAQLIAGIGAGALRSLAMDSQGRIQVIGSAAHDDPDAGDPVGIGFHAVEFNGDPPQVSADDDRVQAIATPQGIQWTLGGHPNIIRREYMTTASQTNDPIIDSIAAGSQIIITAISVMVSSATSVTPQVRIGFGATNPPTEPTTGNTVDDMLISHPGIAAGSGVVEGNGSAAIAVGGDGSELRIANDVPTGGQITVMVSYYISTL